MPTVEQNLHTWNVSYEWPEEGEEWSAAWGGSEAQWFGSILPRIHAFLPTGTILEIAPGLGRWTNYLKNYAEHLILVDVAENCIKACQQRFAYEANITYHVNDGKSLTMVTDNSVDFVFSFDSLVHAEADVLRAYLSQLATKLKSNGGGFIHHSNIGEYQQAFTTFTTRGIPRPLRNLLIQRGIIDQHHGRAFSMTAALFEKYCEETGLQCVSQELVNWGTKRLIDCFSLFTMKTSNWASSNEVIRNPDFMKEANMISRLSHLYTRLKERNSDRGGSRLADASSRWKK